MASSVWGGPHESAEKFMMSFLRACAAGKPYIVTHPLRRRDFVHITTFCEAIEQLTRHKDYKLRYFATGKLTSFWQVYNWLRVITRSEFPNVRFADDESTNYEWFVEKPEFPDTFGEDLEREWRGLMS